MLPARRLPLLKRQRKTNPGNIKTKSTIPKAPQPSFFFRDGRRPRLSLLPSSMMLCSIISSSLALAARLVDLMLEVANLGRRFLRLVQSMKNGRRQSRAAPRCFRPGETGREPVPPCSRP